MRSIYGDVTANARHGTPPSEARVLSDPNSKRSENQRMNVRESGCSLFRSCLQNHVDTYLSRRRLCRRVESQFALCVQVRLTCEIFVRLM